jgi:RNA polymerase sigma factor FliA
MRAPAPIEDTDADLSRAGGGGVPGGVRGGGGVAPLSDAERAAVESHLGLVYRIAGRLSRTLSARVEVDEMVSMGTVGLIGAIRAFDPERGLTFSTFAAPRIRGAILDEVRRADHVPRSVRRKAREIARAEREVERAGKGAATQPEVAAALGLAPEVLHRWRWDVESCTVATVFDSAHAGNRDLAGKQLAEILPDPTPGPDALAAAAIDGARARSALGALTARQREVVISYYYEGQHLLEIAERMGLTEGRISQIRRKAVAAMRAAMGVR